MVGGGYLAPCRQVSVGAYGWEGIYTTKYV